jgi:hypothetical protein
MEGFTMTKRKKNVARPAREARNDGRDKSGRFQPGHSGNPNGRPLKQPEMPKLPDELLAEKFLQKAPVTDADGETRMISAYERTVESLVDSLPTAKLREKIQILEWLEKRSFFHRMIVKASGDAGNPFDEQHDDWLELHTNQKLMKSVTRWPKTAPFKSDKDDEQDPGVFGTPLDAKEN